MNQVFYRINARNRFGTLKDVTFTTLMFGLAVAGAIAVLVR